MARVQATAGPRITAPPLRVTLFEAALTADVIFNRPTPAGMLQLSIKGAKVKGLAAASPGHPVSFPGYNSFGMILAFCSCFTGLCQADDYGDHPFEAVIPIDASWEWGKCWTAPGSPGRQRLPDRGTGG